MFFFFIQENQNLNTWNDISFISGGSHSEKGRWSRWVFILNLKCLCPRIEYKHLHQYPSNVSTWFVFKLWSQTAFAFFFYSFNIFIYIFTHINLSKGSHRNWEKLDFIALTQQMTGKHTDPCWPPSFSLNLWQSSTDINVLKTSGTVPFSSFILGENAEKLFSVLGERWSGVPSKMGVRLEGVRKEEKRGKGRGWWKQDLTFSSQVKNILSAKYSPAQKKYTPMLFFFYTKQVENSASETQFCDSWKLKRPWFKVHSVGRDRLMLGGCGGRSSCRQHTGWRLLVVLRGQTCNECNKMAQPEGSGVTNGAEVLQWGAIAFYLIFKFKCQRTSHFQGWLIGLHPALCGPSS